MVFNLGSVKPCVSMIGYQRVRKEIGGSSKAGQEAVCCHYGAGLPGSMSVSRIGVDVLWRRSGAKGFHGLSLKTTALS